MGMWIGNEREGIYRGTKTLFIDGANIGNTQIERTLLLHKDIKQLYFGAGGCSLINKSQLRFFLNNYNRLIITIEIIVDDIINFLPDEFPELNYIITINNFPFKLINRKTINKMQLKVQNTRDKDKVIYIFSFNNAQNVDTKTLSYKRYEGDDVIC